MGKPLGAFLLGLLATGCLPKAQTELPATDTVPGFVDSHVHLAYFPVADQLAANGIVAAVDLAAPIGSLEKKLPVTMVWAGPMVTGTGGYPTQSWGRNGYGIECADAEAAVTAVNQLHGAGAGVIKIPFTTERRLPDEAIRAGVERAHELGLKVAAHALTDEFASKAADLGVDVLAHTPTDRLSETTIAKWSGRAVISTLGVFGASQITIDNLRKLKEAGATVLYGTDLGNARVFGFDRNELRLLAEAGLTPEEILASATSTPTKYWGLPQSSVEVVVDARWRTDAQLLAKPIRVMR